MSLWREIMTPSRDETAYEWALVALGHVLIGAAVAGLLSLIGATVAATVFGAVVAYWVVKEWGDLRRGGRLLDSFTDTAFVGLGALYAGPWWWPLAAWCAVGAGLLARCAR